MMKSLLHHCAIILMVSFLLSAAAEASMVTILSGEVPAKLGSLDKSGDDPIVLTFGNETVLIHEHPLAGLSGVVGHENISRDKLFLVRDRRAVSKRLGYDVLYSYKGFQLASVEKLEDLTGIKSLTLQRVSKSMAVVERADAMKAAPDPEVEKILERLDANSYEYHLSSLAEDLDSRYLCSPKILEARDIIAEHFKGLGLETYVVKFSSSCWPKRCSAPQGYNVIGIKRGVVSPQKFCLVGAHYDSVNEDAPCKTAPGANDNGSGIAGVMELARLFSTMETNKSMVFVAFSGEEEGMLGSKAFVKALRGTLPRIGGLKAVNLKSFIMLDMISYYKANYGVIVEGSNVKYSQKAAVDKLMQLGTIYTDLQMEKTFDYGDADDEPFLNNGIAGALLIEADWDQDANYHTGEDLVKYQNITYAMEVLRLSAAMVAIETR